jgi:hypothetical protein
LRPSPVPLNPAVSTPWVAPAQFRYVDLVTVLQSYFRRSMIGAISCSQIAREIGVTPNAVIGKMNRLGLSRPKDVIATQLEQRPAAGLARTEESKDLAPKALAPEHLRPAWDADGGVPCTAAAPEDIPIYKRVRMHAARARSGEIRTRTHKSPPEAGMPYCPVYGPVQKLRRFKTPETSPRRTR